MCRREKLPLLWTQFRFLTVIMLMTSRHVPVKEVWFYVKRDDGYPSLGYR
jgi:hypothetical protein